MKSKLPSWIGIALTSLTIAGLPPKGVLAADSQGQFAVRGVGLITCAFYNQQRQVESEIYLMTAAWLDGYITASNQHMSETYDVLPFETTELLAAVLQGHCEKNPDDRVFPVVRKLVEKLYEDRLQTRNAKVEVAMDERKVSLYVAVLKRAQAKLASAGFYDGAINGQYGTTTIEAIKAFQRSIDFNPTGFPDQTTLWRLLRTP